MPRTKTPSDEQMIEALARKMGWQRAVMADWWITNYAQGEGPATVLFADWNPLESLDQVHEVENQLHGGEWDQYMHHIVTLYNDPASLNNCYDSEMAMIRHADARTCATALCRVIDPGVV